MKQEITWLVASVVLILPLGVSAGAEDEKRLKDEVQQAFKQFAAAVKDDKYDEAARWIAPPADKVWTNFITFRSASAKYQQALDDKYGKGPQVPSFLQMFGKKGDLAEHLYETAGAIQEVKPIGKDQVLVRVWTKRPELGRKSETALYERTFTAVKSGDQWKFQLHTFGGTPVVKKVKRKTPDGKEVEVYAEHFPKNVRDKSTWVELKPISYDGREEILKQEAAMWARLAATVQAQTEQVQKGNYKTRKEAIEAMDQAMGKVIEAMRKEHSRR